MTGQIVSKTPDVMGGVPVFAGTRVPVRILMEHLRAGDSLGDFLDDYPSVSRQQAIALLEHSVAILVADAEADEDTAG